jgi:hypothetical protein
MGVFAEPFPNNVHPCWLCRPRFQEIFRNITTQNSARSVYLCLLWFSQYRMNFYLNSIYRFISAHFTPRTRDQPIATPLHTLCNANTQKRKTFIPHIGFELTIPGLCRQRLLRAGNRTAKRALNQLKYFKCTDGYCSYAMSLQLTQRRGFLFECTALLSLTFFCTKRGLSGSQSRSVLLAEATMSAHTGNQTLPSVMPGHNHDKADDNTIHSSPGGPARAKDSFIHKYSVKIQHMKRWWWG